MKSVLITGGTGSFGQAFVRYLLRRDEPGRIAVYSRNEYAQHLMAQALVEHKDRLRFFIGDVRDKDRLYHALKGVDLVIHAAALKRIEVGHYNPLEMVKTNVTGTANLIEAATDAGVLHAILLSSDKAYQPISPYGISKALAESLFINANNTRGWTGPLFAVCRYGNVWNSAGSVVPTWKASIASGTNQVRVTDPDCTRFFMRMDEAIELVMATYNRMVAGFWRTIEGDEIHVPTLPAYRLGDLAEAMGVDMKITGLPPFEKKHESMDTGNSSNTARRMSIQELKEAIDAT